MADEGVKKDDQAASGEEVKEEATSDVAEADNKEDKSEATSDVVEDEAPKSDSAEATQDKEAPKEKEKPVEEKKEEPKKEVEVPKKFKDLVKTIEEMSVLEMAELVKVLEEKFGVSAAAPVAVAAAPAAGGEAAGAEAEEKSSYTVVLTAAGANKIGAIKAVREINQTLGLKEAKDLVDGAPKTVAENLKPEDANAAKEKLEAAGATVELK